MWEGIRFYNRHLVFIQEHLDRLFQGASSLDIDIGISKDNIKSLIISVLNANRMVTDIHIRLIVSRGLKKTPYQHPNANLGGATIVIIPEYKKADKTINKKGISLVTVSTRRGTADTQDPQLNTLSKLNCIFACIEADKKGADEGLMMDVNGNVSTCNSTNFFIIKNKEVWTSTGEYCLPGVTRGAIIRLCKENNIPIYEKDFLVDDVLNADEARFGGIVITPRLYHPLVQKFTRIQYLMNKWRRLTPLIGKWVIFLIQFHDEIAYKPGNSGAKKVAEHFENCTKKMKL